MHGPLDLNAQPNPFFNASLRIGRGLDTMLGLCTGVLADGEVTEAEAQVLRDWIEANPDVTCTWPGNVLAARLERIYGDGRVDEEERAELADLLEQLIGGKVGVAAGANLATTLPVDFPPPPLAFDGQLYVFTGMFAYGPRKVCERAVRERGGDCASGITKKTNVVVIGTFASRDWLHTSHGTKIQKAVEYRSAGVPIVIVGEDHWAQHLEA